VPLTEIKSIAFGAFYKCITNEKWCLFSPSGLNIILPSRVFEMGS